MTKEELLAELLAIVYEEQWSGKTNTSCSCHPEYVDSCKDCGARKYVKDIPGNIISGYSLGTHKSDCKRMNLIKETKTLLEKYNEQCEEEGKDGVYIPL